MLTVVVLNFNHARYLPQSLAALGTQTRPPDEIIIIDDASTDDSIAVISSFLPRLANARLVKNSTNRGAIANVNRGLDMAQGDLVFIAAADDIVYPRFFEAGMAELAVHPEAALFSCRSDVINAQGRNLGPLAAPIPMTLPGYLSPDTVAHQLMRDDNWFMGNATLFRRLPLLAEGGFPEELHAFADGFISRLLALKHGCCFSPEVLAAWRRVEGGMAWSATVSIANAHHLTDMVERKIATAGTVFPRGYAARWKGRYLFGVHRFVLGAARRRAKGSLRRVLALIREAILVVWWFFTLRPWDVVTVGRRLLGSFLAGTPDGRRP